MNTIAKCLLRSWALIYAWLDNLINKHEFARDQSVGNVSATLLRQAGGGCGWLPGHAPLWASTVTVRRRRVISSENIDPTGGEWQQRNELIAEGDPPC